MAADTFFQRLWYFKQPRLVFLLLLPLSWLFGLLVWARRSAFRYGLAKTYEVPRPVVIIGNITVGGTGKTPFTIWLASQLQARGLRVGIVLRGYGGHSRSWPRRVESGTSWQEVGDEAVLLASRTSAIVIAGPDRVADAKYAIQLGAQVVLSDDGLQHYRLRRDAEILVIDAQRGIGNGRLLPAGPLREPRSRLATVDLQVVTRRAGYTTEAPSAYGTSMAIVATARIDSAKSIAHGTTKRLDEFAAAQVHAVAAIGNPDAFFNALRTFGIDVLEHAYPDHASLRREHIVFEDDLPVFMTEKDAVKCSMLADGRHWIVPLEIEVSTAEANIVSAVLDRVLVETAVTT